ncbi:MAG: uridine diphosphate-N-acetylglucosamine-binding protein YvcK [Caldisericia bacterium]|nr:uridine diphosphate-N-acetylglucosamine-binding protein YvcK [Caldisericia bacterium]MDD4614054.1 uridine diphosphate-N-acetylglucosamine-binding protein YvcK [Caldisericia bacterium]
MLSKKRNTPRWWDCFLRWFAPGMKVKRWILLILFGFFMLAVAVMVLIDFTSLGILKRVFIDFLIDVFGKNRLYTPTWMSQLLGVVVLGGASFFVILGIRNLLRSVIDSLLPEREKEISDLIREYRFKDDMLNVLVIGGGTGIYPFLEALKTLPVSTTAIVTVADNGGSSGILRNEYSIPAPGDIRRALIALSDRKSADLDHLFNYRFEEGSLQGHTVGNLMIAGYTEMTGDFSESIYKMSQILSVKGKVIPFTLNNLTLCAEFDDGTMVQGESEIHKVHKTIKRVFYDPPYYKPMIRVIEELDKADIVLMGPGSLYTSILPCLIISPIADILFQSDALKIYVANLMTETGETDNLSVTGHLKALFFNAGKKVADYVMINNGTINPELEELYKQYHAKPVFPDIEAIQSLQVEPLFYDLVDPASDRIRHCPDKVKTALADVIHNFTHIRGKKIRF